MSLPRRLFVFPVVRPEGRSIPVVTFSSINRGWRSIRADQTFSGVIAISTKDLSVSEGSNHCGLGTLAPRLRIT